MSHLGGVGLMFGTGDEVRIGIGETLRDYTLLFGLTFMRW